MFFSAALTALAAHAALAASSAYAEVTYRTVMASDGVPLNVAETGTAGAPALLLLHGVGQSHHSWIRQLDSDLATKFHMVAFDLRGHGGSGKPWTAESYRNACTWADDVAAVMAATALVKPVMVLWSYGGTVGMHYVRCRGVGNLSGIVFAASRAGLYPNPGVNPAIPAASANMADPDLGKNLAGADAFAGFLSAEPPPPPLAAATRIMNLMYPPYARQANDGPQMLPDGKTYRDNTDLIPALTVPLMFAFGERDGFSNAAAGAAAVKTLFPSARNVTYPGVGHWLFFQAAETFNRDLAAFAADAFAAAKTQPTR